MNTYKSKYTSNASPVYVSDYMSGKLSGIPAISTSVLLNPRCIARAKNPDSVCAHCFAVNTANRYKDLRHHLEENYEVLTSSVLERDELPRFKKTVGMVRLEAFGDLANAEQACNYLNIALVNPHVHIALWTKNPDILQEGFDLFGMRKPKNLQIIYSSFKLNEPELDILERYAFIDKVFTVYDKEHADDINCGARDCGTCAKCYFESTVKEIKEKLK